MKRNSNTTIINLRVATRILNKITTRVGIVTKRAKVTKRNPYGPSTNLSNWSI